MIFAAMSLTALVSECMALLMPLTIPFTRSLPQFQAWLARFFTKLTALLKPFWIEVTMLEMVPLIPD